MEQAAVSLWTALFLFVFTAAYIAAFFFLWFKALRGPRRRREEFKRRAVEEGRQTFALLRRFDETEDRDGDGGVRGYTYRGRYTYTGVDGRERKLTYTYGGMPPERLTLYLDPENPRKFLLESDIHGGKHPAAATLLPLLGGLILYMTILRFLFLR